MAREKDLEQKLVRKIKMAGGICYKFMSSEAGVPDRLVLMPNGMMAFVEMKAPGKKPRPLQEWQMERISKLGFRVEVIDSEEGIEELAKEMKSNAIQTT